MATSSYYQGESTPEQLQAAKDEAQRQRLAAYTARDGDYKGFDTQVANINASANNTYLTNQSSAGLGNVKGLFNTQSALFGGSTETAAQNMADTWNNASHQIDAQKASLGNAGDVLSANNATTANLSGLANENQLAIANNLQGQGNQALSVGNNQTQLLGQIAGPQQTGSAALGQSIAGLQNYAQQGPGPSIAQAQLAQSTDANIRQAIALGASGRGAGASGAAQAQAGSQAAAALAQGSQQAALLRAQEQQQWRQQQMQAYEAAGQLGNSLQGQNLATSQFALGQQQAAAQNALSYQQLAQGYNTTAAQQQAQASANLMQRAALGQQNAGLYAGYNMTYGQEQAAALAAAQAQQQAQLSTEAQLRVNGINAANATSAGLQQTAMNIDAQSAAAEKAANAAMIGAGLQVGGAVVGGLIGGPAGAAAGNSAGSAAGAAAAR